MLNKNITKELKENKKGNVLFNNQNASDLDELKEILEEEGKIVIDFPQEELNNALSIIKEETTQYQLRAMRKYVASKILSTLESKYKQLDIYNGKKNLETFQNNDKDYYFVRDDMIYNLHDIKDILEVEDIKIDRINFILNGVSSPLLCNAISLLLREDNPYDISVYLSSEEFSTTIVPDRYDEAYLWEAYNYRIYNGFQEGKENIATKNDYYTK